MGSAGAAHGLQSTGSAVALRRPGGSAARGVFLDQESNPRLLHQLAGLSTTELRGKPRIDDFRRQCYLLRLFLTALVFQALGSSFHLGPGSPKCCPLAVGSLREWRPRGSGDPCQWWADTFLPLSRLGQESPPSPTSFLGLKVVSASQKSKS